MATKRNPPAKKAAPAKKTAPVAKKVPPKAGSRSSADHPAAVVGELGAPRGVLSLRVGRKWIAVSTIVGEHNDAILTLEFKLSSANLQAQTENLSDLAQALQEFLKLRAMGKPDGGATCCHSEQ